jgi:hypothetical protein
MSLRRSALAVLACGALVATVLASPVRLAWAHHMDGWVHDHSSAAIPPRPDGLSEIQDVFGPVCGDKANDARSFWPSQDQDGAGYVYYHSYIGRDVGYNIRNHVEADHNNAAVRWLVGGYNCRYIAGTTSWSLHAWGAAIDTNSSLNPMGQDHWNGTGIDGQKYGTYLPDIWRGPYPGHKFFWGLNWDSKPDPMHFQYATGY